MIPSETNPSATGDFLVSLTRLQLRSSLYLPHFFWYTWRSIRQIKHVKGFREGCLARDANGAYWTVTAWENLAAMRDFRNKGAHMAAVPKLLYWCDEASVAHWQQGRSALPDGVEMLEKMRALGQVSKVSRLRRHMLQVTRPVALRPLQVLVLARPAVPNEIVSSFDPACEIVGKPVFPDVSPGATSFFRKSRWHANAAKTLRHRVACHRTRRRTGRTSFLRHVP